MSTKITQVCATAEELSATVAELGMKAERFPEHVAGYGQAQLEIRRVLYRHQQRCATCSAVEIAGPPPGNGIPAAREIVAGMRGDDRRMLRSILTPKMSPSRRAQLIVHSGLGLGALRVAQIFDHHSHGLRRAA